MIQHKIGLPKVALTRKPCYRRSNHIFNFAKKIEGICFFQNFFVGSKMINNKVAYFKLDSRTKKSIDIIQS